jgi:hypothetical protein
MQHLATLQVQYKCANICISCKLLLNTNSNRFLLVTEKNACARKIKLFLLFLSQMLFSKQNIKILKLENLAKYMHQTSSSNSRHENLLLIVSLSCCTKVQTTC